MRAITTAEIDVDELRGALQTAAIKVTAIDLVEPTLEDVFLALAG